MTRVAMHFYGAKPESGKDDGGDDPGKKDENAEQRAKEEELRLKTYLWPQFENMLDTSFNITKSASSLILFDETKLFCDWYVPKILSKLKSIKFKKKFKLEIKKLLSKLNYKNVTFVHRDFHVSNLMYHNKKIAVIDSQDALIGNRAYDLASLIDDVRLKTPNELKEKVFKFYIKTNKKIDLTSFPSTRGNLVTI